MVYLVDSNVFIREAKASLGIRYLSGNLGVTGARERNTVCSNH
jgi:hypothetical protein